ncbi:mucin-13-like isoform X2 [Portunus trituberculatus]|nr:mucin-13-like isoform X2 [Portunus trituberculatus]
MVVVTYSELGEAHPVANKSKLDKHKVALKTPSKPGKQVKERKEDERELSTISSVTFSVSSSSSSSSSSSMRRPEYLNASLFRHQVTGRRQAHTLPHATTRQELPTLTETLPGLTINTPVNPTEPQTTEKAQTSPPNTSEQTPDSPTGITNQPSTETDPEITSQPPVSPPDSLKGTNQPPSSLPAPSDPAETYAEVDYDGFFSAWEDVSPFEGERGLTRGDVEGGRYVVGFRPLGF